MKYMRQSVWALLFVASTVAQAAPDSASRQLPQREPCSCVLPLQCHQTGRAVSRRHPEYHQHHRDHGEQPGFPTELAGVAHHSGAHNASTAARKRSPRSS